MAILFRGLWLPDGERHIPKIMKRRKHFVKGVGTYQFHKLELAMKSVGRRRVAVDVGAHVGTWSAHLCDLFGQVVAFEPVPANRECWALNVVAANATLYPFALGSAPGDARIRTYGTSSGAAHVVAPGMAEGSGHLVDVGVSMRTLDSFGIENVDLLKIDVEGWELEVVKGARETIIANRPVLVVEQKGREIKTYKQDKRDQAVEWLEQDLGMVRLGEYGGDWIMGWKENLASL